MKTVKCSQFVQRQTEDSPFSYFDGSWEQLAKLATNMLEDARVYQLLDASVERRPNAYPGSVRDGYKPGVLLVSVPPIVQLLSEDDVDNCRFYSGVVEVTNADSGCHYCGNPTNLGVRFQARREGEAKFLEVLAYGEKQEAKFVDLVLYSRALLIEEGEEVGDEDYQIVSINARLDEEPEPMTPMAMARNQLGLPGGTKAEYTAEQMAKSIIYWSTRVMHGGTR